MNMECFGKSMGQTMGKGWMEFCNLVVQRNTPISLSKKILCSLKMFRLIVETWALGFLQRSNNSEKCAIWVALIQSISAEEEREFLLTTTERVFGAVFSLLKNISAALTTFLVTEINFACEENLLMFMRGFLVSPILMNKLVLLSGVIWSVRVL